MSYLALQNRRIVSQSVISLFLLAFEEVETHWSRRCSEA